jgi:3-methyl-2-oxobutanoate hydroxymethyltransferase
MNVLDFQKMKNAGRKISMVTCYDYSSARAVAASSIDCVLVGDSLAMVMHGHPTTLSATTAMMALHTASVARGAPMKLIVADLPFLSYRKGLEDAMDSVQELMSAGAHAVNTFGVIQAALNAYDCDVKDGGFPSDSESYDAQPASLQLGHAA